MASAWIAAAHAQTGKETEKNAANRIGRGGILSGFFSMPFRNWRLNVALGVAVALLAMWLGWAFLEKDRHHTRDRERGAAYANQQRGEEHAFCVIVPGANISFCPDEAAPTEPNQEYAYYDLKAQQEMARWAFALFWVGAASLVLTGLGIYFVARTLDTALSANDGFAQHSRAELRAYVFIDPEQPLETFRVVADKAISGMLRMKNLGLTPAHRVAIERRVALATQWPLPKGVVLPLNLDAPSDARSKHVIPHGGLVFPSLGEGNDGAQTVSKDKVVEILAGRLFVIVYGRIVYDDAFRRPHWTNFCFRVTPSADGQRADGCQLAHEHNDADDNQ